MKRITLSFFILGLFLSPAATAVLADAPKVEINFFYNPTCPHCAKEEIFLDQLQEKYPDLKINRYDVLNYQKNQDLLTDFYEKYNVPKKERGFVPITFTPVRYFIGFNEEIGGDIESCLKECLVGSQTNASQSIKVPILGELDIAKASLPLLTLVIGFLDGFNPCAMWILLVLVSLLLPLRSRKKIVLVGGTFIIAEGLLYFLFMTAWLNAFLAIQYGAITRLLIGIFAIVFGIWRFKEFLTWQPGVCKVVNHSKSQGKILDRMNNVLKAATLPATILGVIALAFAVNLIEFVCSAGFPVLYTRILALQNIGTIQQYLYLFLYNILYMLDDLIVFGIALFSLSRLTLSDKYNRYSTLIAAVLIFVLGLLLIFRPGLLMFG